MALTAKKVYAILKRQISNMEAKLNSPVRYRGTVATADLLPLNPDIGDMYNIESKSVYGEAGMNVAWNGVVWDTMGAPIDMSLYIKSSELADWVKQQNKPTYTAEEVGALPADTKIPSKTSDLQNDSGFLTKIPDNYLSGTDKTLSASGKAADAKATGDKITELSADISNKLNKNQGSENSGKIAGINESGDIVPMFPVSVDYNEETNCLEFGSDQKMELNKGINLDSTLTKTGYAADAGAVGEITNSLKEDISNKITKFYASSQGENHLADSDNGKIMDMMLYGRSEQKQYSGKNLLNATLQTTTRNGVTCTANGDGTYTLDGTANANAVFNLGSVTFTGDTKYKICGCPQGGGTGERYHIEPHGSTNEQRDIGNGVIYSLPNDETKVIYIVVTIGFRVNNLLFKPMITTDLTATYDDFEPYTGGIPSPNPDYPQEIKSVVNPTVKVCGKNFLKATLQTTTQSGVTFTANGDGTYTLNGIAKALIDVSLSTNFHIENGKMYRITGWVKNVSGSIYLANGKNSAGDTGDGVTFTYIDATNDSKVIHIQIPKGAIINNVIIKPMICTDASATYDDFEPYHEQTATLPYTLNAIPVNSGGNVTIDGQQYIADYVDVERGKLVRMCKEHVITGSERLAMYWLGNASYLRNVCCINNFENIVLYDGINPLAMSDMFIGKISKDADDERAIYLMLRGSGDKTLAIKFLDSDGITTVDLAKQWLIEHKPKIVIVLSTPTEIDLTPEEIAAFKALATYYPITNISVNSEQLDGYTVFNYPISMANGWNYIKKQLNDNRDYIYDMDTQSAEAYVNSEYAVALTELEV